MRSAHCIQLAFNAFQDIRYFPLETPIGIYDLVDLGYDLKIIEVSATAIAAMSVFRILSDEGAVIIIRLNA